MWNYTNAVHEHFLRPHNAGPMEDANAIGEVGSLACGDALKLYLKINDEGIIEKASFETFGCASAIASSSVLTDMVKGMKAILLLLILTVVFNLFLTPGEPLITLWKLTITKEGLITAIKMAVRLSFLIIGSSVMTLTTTPNNLTDGMESLLHPLKRIHVPVHEISMMMSIALRFIPILLEETDKIMKAQIARGADFESGNLIKKAKSMVPLLVPLFISAFRRANDLAMAMEARCYRGGDGRTKMKPLIYKKRDYTAYGILALYLTAAVVIGRILL